MPDSPARQAARMGRSLRNMLAIDKARQERGVEPETEMEKLARDTIWHIFQFENTTVDAVESVLNLGGHNDQITSR